MRGLGLLFQDSVTRVDSRVQRTQGPLDADRLSSAGGTHPPPPSISKNYLERPLFPI